MSGVRKICHLERRARGVALRGGTGTTANLNRGRASLRHHGKTETPREKVDIAVYFPIGLAQ